MFLSEQMNATLAVGGLLIVSAVAAANLADAKEQLDGRNIELLKDQQIDESRQW
jgi:hypothetical protein